MAWKKGQSGNPRGRPREKPFADVLRIALSEEDSITKRPKLRVIADKLVEQAIAGEPWAVKEVMDRVDGKAVQQAEVDLSVNEFSDWTNEELREFILSESARMGIADDLPPKAKGVQKKPRASGAH